jgi:predicted membrane GTPase involved in stress response
MGMVFEKYEPFKGELSRRNPGSLVAFETAKRSSMDYKTPMSAAPFFIAPHPYTPV